MYTGVAIFVILYLLYPHLVEIRLLLYKNCYVSISDSGRGYLG